MSLAMRLISAGEPAPSMTTTSFSARSSSKACAICGQTRSLRPRHGRVDSASLTCPISTTWLWVSRSGLSSSGFMRTSGTALAARAWKYWALPISPPSTTRALLLMFCALNGATRSPWRAYHRHSAVASQLLPAPLVVPRTMTQRAGPLVALELIRGLSLSAEPNPESRIGRTKGCGPLRAASAKPCPPSTIWR
ncbi:hypothetical protein D3C71_867520 [compost metagenome]